MTIEETQLVKCALALRYPPFQFYYDKPCRGHQTAQARGGKLGMSHQDLGTIGVRDLLIKMLFNN